MYLPKIWIFICRVHLLLASHLKSNWRVSNTTLISIAAKCDFTARTMAASVKERATKAHETPSEAQVWFLLGTPRNESQGRCKTGKRLYTGTAHRRFLIMLSTSISERTGGRRACGTPGRLSQFLIHRPHLPSRSPAHLVPSSRPQTLATGNSCWHTSASLLKNTGWCMRGITPTRKPLRSHEALRAANILCPIKP